MPIVRVAFDVGPVRREPTGVGVFAASMATALAGLSQDGELALVGRREEASGLPDTLPSTPLVLGGYLPWLQLRAPRDVRRMGADIGHFSDGIVPFVRTTPTVVSVHDLSVVRSWRTHPARRWSRIPLALMTPRIADVVVVPSRATADEVVTLTRTPASKIEVVPYAPQPTSRRPDAADVDATLARYGLSRHGFILALGTIEPRKNHARLVEAFERLSASATIPGGMLLVIVGRPAWRSGPILARIERSPAAARMRRLGYVPADDLPALLTGAAVAAYPSLYEGFGLPVVEAMAHGAPTVTSDRSSMPELAGDAAFLVDPYDVGDIARGLETALRAADTDRAGIAARAAQQASRFTWERAARSMLDIYRSRFG
jgi:glycosyltransferase involved in cell wall biosynthesis